MRIGIDLGTTFSAVASVRDSGIAEIITNRDGDRTTPSVVMFEDGAIVVGEQAKENSVVDPYNVCQFVKRQMGKSSFSFDVSATEKYRAEEISAMILKRLKEDAEASCGEKADGAVITVPAYFDDAQRKATQDAGEIAGLNVIGIINEPTAAAIAYCHGQTNADGNVMVYDLGGGTFDITIMRLSDNLKKVDILATTGNRNLGGFDFDNAIINKVVEEANRQYGIDLEDDDTAYQDLRIKAENAKKALSNRPKANIALVSQGKAIKVEITRDEFDSLIKSYLESTKISMEMAMDDANLHWSDISKIILVGGSTRVPAVQNMIRELTGIEPSHDLNPDEAVAIGAAYYADMIQVEDEQEQSKVERVVQVTDVNSHSLGVITYDNNIPAATFILMRNTPLPASNEMVFYTRTEGQEALDVVIVEGEDEDPNYDTIIGQARMMLTPRPANSPIAVAMQYDVNGIIHVRLRDEVDGRDLGEMHIERDLNLSAADVEEKKTKFDQINIE
ncbi:molecular chaperone DnaK [Lachnospiraceae bacterium XBD2001]|nr:molecular chaperone DnaK [Lachnospiraceae bacterium XBD2001]